MARYHPALINRKHVLLRHHDNAQAAHTAALIDAKLKELTKKLNVILIPHIALMLRYPTIACSAHGSFPLLRLGLRFCRSRRRERVSCRVCASKPTAERFVVELKQLTRRYLKVIINYGIYYEEKWSHIFTLKKISFCRR